MAKQPKNEEKKYCKIAGRLREFIDNNYKSIADCERDLGLSPKSLNNYLSGNHGMGIDLLTKLALKGCDMNWLIVGKQSEDNRLDEKIKDLAISQQLKLNDLEKEIEKLRK